MYTESSINRYVELFMKYIEVFEIPEPKCKVRFIDLDDTIIVDYSVYHWLVYQLHNNLDILELVCKKYQSKYPTAWQKIEKRIEKRKNYLTREEKVKLFMEYININSIPHAKLDIKFCDISTTTSNTTNVGIWLQSQLQNCEAKFFDECLKYKDSYPNAYKKLLHKLKKRNTDEIEHQRIRIFLYCIEKNITLENKRFCNIDKNFVDNTEIKNWWSSKIQREIDNILDEIIIYKEEYPNAIIKINNRINLIKQKRDENILSDENRVYYLIKYLEENELTNELSFCNLDSNITDSSKIESWLSNTLFKNQKEFINKYSKYQEIYPIGYQKLETKLRKFIEYSQKRSNIISYEEKMKSLVSFLEQNSIKDITSKTTFLDINLNCNDNSIVKSWFSNNISKELTKFINELQKYQEIYPVGYQTIINIINKGTSRLSNERKKLLSILIQLRNEIVEDDKKTLYKIKKI